MTNQDDPRGVDQELPEATIRKRRGISAVWAIPLVAAAVAGFLLFEHLTQAGPEITIAFADGQNISTSATIRYRGVDIGKVQSIALSPNLKQVAVEARLAGSAAGLARQGTKFWIVRPEISLSGIQGLGTIVSGSYITLEPGAGEETRTFTGLAGPPDPTPGEKGRKFSLRGETLNSVGTGTPVLYREVEVGRVISAELSEDRNGVDILVFIEADYAPLVRQNTIFWNASGIEADISVLETKINIDSLSTLLKGGISFANPVAPGQVAEEGSIFRVNDSAPPSYVIAPDSGELHVVLTAMQSGSVAAGDPVYYREVRVGSVSHIELAEDSQSVDIHVEIDKYHAPLVRSNTVFWNASGLHATAGLFSGAKIDIESLQSLLAGGIALATPDQPGPPAISGSVFPLQAEAKDEWKAWSPGIVIAPPHADLARHPATVGTDHETMKRIQQALKDRGFFTGQIDGLYGPKTRAALQAYQKTAGMDATGVPDAATLAGLLP